MNRTPPAVLAVIAVIVAGCGSGRGTSTGSTTPTGGSKTTVTMHGKAVRFAECMRGNGVSAFPDPDASGGLTLDAVANGSSIDTDSAAFTHAMSACRSLEPAGFTGHTRTAEEQKGALAFARCIRDNGVKDFPDPARDQPMVDTNRIPSANRPGGMSILNAAMRKCGGLAAAAGVTGDR